MQVTPLHLWNEIVSKIENLMRAGVTVFFDGKKIKRVTEDQLTSKSFLIEGDKIVDFSYVSSYYPYPPRVIKSKFTKISNVFNKNIGG